MKKLSDKEKKVMSVAEKQEESTLVEKKKTNEIVTQVVGKASETGKKGIKVATNVLMQTASGSKVLASGIAKEAKEFSEKSKIDSYNRRMKKFNPLFIEEYNSPEFFVPNIINIVDDAVRRDIDVCKGAIGWRENKKGTEVLFLYDEFVEQSGLKFIPNASCDEIYYVDPFDRKCFVKLDYIFQRTHEEKLAELEHIAYSLGAKSCSIEMEEKEVTYVKKKKETKVKENKKAFTISGTEHYEVESKSDSAQYRSSKNETNFTGNENVFAPKLKWYANDSNILNLVEYRCNGGNAVTSKTLKLIGASSATMSRKAASDIDAVVADMGIKHNYAMEEQSVKESKTTIVYHLEF